MTKREYASDLSDAQIVKVLRARKRRRRVIRRVILRLSLFLLVLALLAAGLIFGIRYGTSHSHASSGEDQEIRGTICLDPGHGGSDTGNTFRRRTEKNDTLALAKAIRKELRKLGFRVVLTREEDTRVTSPQRTGIANRSNAGFFLSLHRSLGTAEHGVTMYIPTENGARDRALAENIMAELKETGISQTKGVKLGTPDDPRKNFPENCCTNMPSALLELGYVSDRRDNGLLDARKFVYAKAIAAGISKTYAQYYETK